MTSKAMQQIRNQVALKREQAERIYSGDSDNYDGADGARIVLELCRYLDMALAAITPEDDPGKVVIGRPLDS